MFSFFSKNPEKKLKQRYEKKLQDAMAAQRNGDIKTYSSLTEEAEKIREELDALEAK